MIMQQHLNLNLYYIQITRITFTMYDITIKRVY